jgi:hypothetical protein
LDVGRWSRGNLSLNGNGGWIGLPGPRGLASRVQV